MKHKLIKLTLILAIVLVPVTAECQNLLRPRAMVERNSAKGEDLLKEQLRKELIEEFKRKNLPIYPITDKVLNRFLILLRKRGYTAAKLARAFRRIIERKIRMGTLRLGIDPQRDTLLVEQLADTLVTGEVGMGLPGKVEPRASLKLLQESI